MLAFSHDDPHGENGTGIAETSSCHGPETRSICPAGQTTFAGVATSTPPITAGALKRSCSLQSKCGRSFLPPCSSFHSCEKVHTYTQRPLPVSKDSLTFNFVVRTPWRDYGIQHRVAQRVFANTDRGTTDFGECLRFPCANSGCFHHTRQLSLPNLICLSADRFEPGTRKQSNLG